jgi:hypothetical protein
MNTTDRFIIPAERPTREVVVHVDHGERISTDVLFVARSFNVDYNGLIHDAYTYVDITYTVPGVGQTFITSGNAGTAISHINAETGQHHVLSPRI